MEAYGSLRPPTTTEAPRDGHQRLGPPFFDVVLFGRSRVESGLILKCDSFIKNRFERTGCKPSGYRGLPCPTLCLSSFSARFLRAAYALLSI